MQGSPQFVPPAERVATFDQDGTLWVEHPMYSQVIYCLDSVPALVRKKPELANVEPFKTVMSGNREAIVKLPLKDLEKILAATLTGMSVDESTAEARKWLDTAKDPRWKRPYTELTYQPMQEVPKYLRDNGYRTYIVTGGGQDFVRVYDEKTYGIPPPTAIGRCSSTPARGDGAWLMMLVLHDDAKREYAYGPARGLKNTKVGTFTETLYDEARRKGWTVTSMKDDWKRIFAFE